MRLPMFPLGNVLLPGELLPLTIFEPRYRRLVLDCLADDGLPEFGVVLIERGHEVGGGDARTSVGTIARILRVMPLGGGRFNLVTAGTRRISVLEWLDDDPYPRGDAEEWPEVGTADADGLVDDEPRPRLEAMVERIDELRRMASRVVEDTAQRRSDAPAQPLRLSDDAVRASYQLAAHSPIGAADRYRVLVAPSVAARIDVLAAALDDAEAMLRFRLA